MRRDARESGEVEVEPLEANGEHPRQLRQLDPLEGVAAAPALVARVLVGAVEHLFRVRVGARARVRVRVGVRVGVRVLVGAVEHLGLKEGGEGLLDGAVECGRRAEGADG